MNYVSVNSKILTEFGYKSIQDIKVGDNVVTHLGRLKKVIKICNKKAKVGKLKINGNFFEEKITGNHMIFAGNRIIKTKNKKRESYVENVGFIQAKNMIGKYICQFTGKTNIPIAEFPDFYKCENEEIMEFIGWYLGDGSISQEKTNYRITLHINPNKFKKFQEVFEGKINYEIRKRDDTRWDLRINCTKMGKWLKKWFGRGAEFKFIPAWCYSLEESLKNRLLDGYIKTDGSFDKKTNLITIESVSKSLVYGISMLKNFSGVSLGSKPREKEIKGKTYHCKQTYKVVMTNNKNKNIFVNGNYSYRKCLDFIDLNEIETVYNIEVEDDNSYVVNGIIVQNY